MTSRTKDRRRGRPVAADRPEPGARRCEWPGCEADGAYRAPVSRRDLHSYRWFCLEHVRQYNAAWNYYADMSDDEIEADIRRDTVWQRPTWPLGGGRAFAGGARVADDFGLFDDHGGPDVRAEPEEPASGASSPERRALAVLDLKPPLTVATLKARYKDLVKRHHPDANGGDKASEERFKQIGEAYQTLMHCLTS